MFGNLLAVLFGLADDIGRGAHSAPPARSQIASRPSAHACWRPIEPDPPLWRDYMVRHRQNLVYQYHNGGCWPMVGGFWVMTLAALGDDADARGASSSWRAPTRVNNWQFNEWFHGLTGEPMGMPGQSWNAAAYLMAWAAVRRISL